MRNTKPEITQFGDPILRRKAKTVQGSDLKMATTHALIKRMFVVMRRLGVGLAAPQVGKSIRLAVVEIKKTKIRPHVKPLSATVIVNPQIVSASKKIVDDWEGCLSLPDVYGVVPRHESISVEYYTKDGEKQFVNLKGFQARVFQHEIDHMHGILYLDRVLDMKTIMTADEFKKKIVKKRGLKSK